MTTPGSRTGRVGVGIIGAGTISHEYLANLTSYPDVEVRFVADLIPERAREQATRYGVRDAGSLAEALARDDVEIAVNLTIPAAHAEVAAAALAAGKHVWNEKPITTDRDSGTALVAQAEAADLLLGTAPDTVLGPGFQTARRLIERGEIGRPLTASVTMQYAGPHTWHPNPEFLYQRGAGPLFDMGPYYLTVLAQTLGAITRAAAMGSSAGPTRIIARGPKANQEFGVEVPTHVSALYEFETGAIAQATFSFDSQLKRMGVVEISGTEATIALPDPNSFGGEVRVTDGRADGWTTIAVDGADRGRGIGVVDMARALRGGGQHRATGRLGLHVLDTMLATAESIDTGAFVAVQSGVDHVPPLPEHWDPREATL